MRRCGREWGVQATTRGAAGGPGGGACCSPSPGDWAKRATADQSGPKRTNQQSAGCLPRSRLGCGREQRGWRRWRRCKATVGEVMAPAHENRADVDGDGLLDYGDYRRLFSRDPRRPCDVLAYIVTNSHSAQRKFPIHAARLSRQMRTMSVPMLGICGQP